MAPVSEPTTLDLSPATTLTAVLIERATKEPERPHIYLQKESGDETIIRYGKLLEKASQIAKGLCQRGIYIDSILLLGLLPEGTLFVAKKKLLQAPIIRTFIKKLRFLTVDRLDFSQSLVDMKHIEQCIKNKSSILVFPEGTFTYATGLRRFKLGAFNLSVETGLSICPIAIQGSRSILRGDKRLLQPGSIKITVGQPVTPLEKNWNEVVRLHILTRNEIAMHCGEPVLDLVSAGFKKD